MGQRLFQILFGRQTGQLGVVIAQLIVHDLHEVLSGDDADQLVVLIQYRDGVFGVVLNAGDTVLNALVRVEEGVGGGDQLLQIVVLPSPDQVGQFNGTVKRLVLSSDVDGGDVVAVCRLGHQLMHGLLDGHVRDDGDIVGRHNAADLVLGVSPQAGDLLTGFVVHQFQQGVFVVAGQGLEVVYGQVGVHAGEHIDPLAQAQLVEKMAGGVHIGQDFGQGVCVQHLIDQFALVGGQLLQRIGNVAFMVVGKLVLKCLWGGVAAQDGAQFLRVVGMLHLILIVVVFHVQTSFDVVRE